jgi:hypothetical protein
VLIVGDLYVTGTIYCDNPIQPLPDALPGPLEPSRGETILARAKALVSRLLPAR